jgi:hypothetical protein
MGLLTKFYGTWEAKNSVFDALFFGFELKKLGKWLSLLK